MSICQTNKITFIDADYKALIMPFNATNVVSHGSTFEPTRSNPFYYTDFTAVKFTYIRSQ